MPINIPAGSGINDFNVIIEIPAECGSVKYELDKESGLLRVDRFMPTSMHYPCNYGFIPNTLAADGDPADVLVIAPYAVTPGCLLRARGLGILNMTDEGGDDSKILAVPIEKTCQQMANIKTLKDVPKIMLDSISHFFQHYKELEPNKWVKIRGWEGKEEDEKELQGSMRRCRQQLEATHP